MSFLSIVSGFCAKKVSDSVFSVHSFGSLQRKCQIVSFLYIERAVDLL